MPADCAWLGRALGPRRLEDIDVCLEVGMADGSATSMERLGCAWKRAWAGLGGGELGSDGACIRGSGQVAKIHLTPLAAGGKTSSAQRAGATAEASERSQEAAAQCTQSLYLDDMFFANSGRARRSCIRTSSLTAFPNIVRVSTSTVSVGRARTRRAWDTPGGTHAHDKSDSKARSNLRL